jgi:hypothetical protein
MISICRHIKTNGARCQSNALRDRPYCYYHGRLHRVLNKPKAGRKNSLALHPIEDQSSILMGLSDVICGLAAGRIDSNDAARLIYGLQVAGKFAPHSVADAAPDAVKSVDLMKSGDELAPQQSYCTDDDDCDSCRFSGVCALEKAQEFRAVAETAEAELEGDEEDLSDANNS